MDTQKVLPEFEQSLRERRMANRSVIRYLSIARDFVTFLGPDRAPDHFAVRDFLVSKNHGQCKPQTLAVFSTAIRSLLGHFAFEGDDTAAKTLVVLAAHPLVPKVRQTDLKQIVPVTREMYLTARAKMRRFRHQVATDLLYWTGARISEVFGEEKAGIPPLTVKHGIELVEQGWTKTQGKGGKIRTLVLPVGARDSLRKYLHPRRAALALGVPLEQAPLFKMVGQSYWLVLKSVGIHGAHGFRHGYRDRARRAGLSDELQSALLGHGPSNVTRGYGKVELDELQAAVEQMWRAEDGATQAA
jgi:site-specific recombinase XerD